MNLELNENDRSNLWDLLPYMLLVYQEFTSTLFRCAIVLFIVNIDIKTFMFVSKWHLFPIYISFLNL